MDRLNRTKDVVVIGGGINGVAIARDCAMRGLSVALFEKEDLCSGSSGAWTGLLARDKRNYSFHRKRTEFEREDLEGIQRIAPNLFYKDPVLLPVLSGKLRFLSHANEAWLSANRRLMGWLGSESLERIDANELKKIEPSLSERAVAATRLEEWAIDPVRMVILTAKSATRYGAGIYPNCAVESVECEKNTVVGVKVIVEGKSRLVKAKVVINATGTWAPFIEPRHTKNLKMRPTKGVHVIFRGRFVNHTSILEGVDGRPSVFVMPRKQITVVGTSDSDYYGHPDKLTLAQEDLGHLLQTVRRYFPNLVRQPIHQVFAGIRSHIHRWSIPSSDLSDRHQILSHEEFGGKGFYSLVGGTFLSHRRVADEFTNLAMKSLGKGVEKSRTDLESLPGCTDDLPWEEEANRVGMDPTIVRHLMYRHGYEAIGILERAKKDPQLAKVLCETNSIIAAEVEYFVREEWATNVVGVFRRARLGAGTWYPDSSIRSIAHFMGGLLEWEQPEVESQVQYAIRQPYRGPLPVLYP